MDNLIIIGNADFLTKIVKGILETLIVSMIEIDMFKLHKGLLYKQIKGHELCHLSTDLVV